MDDLGLYLLELNRNFNIAFGTYMGKSKLQLLTNERLLIERQKKVNFLFHLIS